MKSTQLLATAATIALLPAAASALGVDRTGQNITVLFEKGNYAELSFAHGMPDVTGEDSDLYAAPNVLALPGGADIDNVGNDFNQFGAALKMDIDDKLSFALIFDKPFGSDGEYDDAPSVPTPGGDSSNLLGGTKAKLKSKAITALARYKFNENYSVHGGLRYTNVEADVTLRGLAFGGLSGYSADFEDDWDLGYVIGAAYERPELALRVALTYNSKTEHKLHTEENLPLALQGAFGLPAQVTSTTTVEIPESVNLDFQMGLNPKTLLFGQLRYAWYEDFQTSPRVFDAAADPGNDGTSLTEASDKWSLKIGVGRQLTDKLAGSITLGYEPDEDNNVLTPLNPASDGFKSIALGLAYKATDAVTISGGVTYISLNDTRVGTGIPREERATFDSNDIVAVGMKVGYRF
ncbi:OmpP1/FadL family transporter [Palleronia caenipelagi]|nr:outer membrane protein transport protein [Palleronia caenipelagi]